MRMKVYLWVRKGKGKECITSLTIEKKPDSMSVVELTSRAGHAKASNKILCWHPHLHFEFRAEQSIKAGKGGFGVNDIQISLTEEQSEDLELKGYRLAKDLSTFGFNCRYAGRPYVLLCTLHLSSVSLWLYYDCTNITLLSYTHTTNLYLTIYSTLTLQSTR